jgi:hypothetical protein
MTTIKTWQKRTHEDQWQSETIVYMQAEIDELRARVAELEGKHAALQILVDLAEAREEGLVTRVSEQDKLLEQALRESEISSKPSNICNST